jgi:hypothetical protein
MTTNTARKLNNDARRARRAIRKATNRGFTGDTRQHIHRAAWSVQRAHKQVRPELATTNGDA